MPEVVLAGCTPEPLMGYLKTLGVFRIVAEQADRSARLSWRGGAGLLHSTLDRDGVLKFFQKDYRPTPVITPWNGGSGFYRTWDNKARKFRNREAVDRVCFMRESKDACLEPYRRVLQQIDETLAAYSSPIDVPSMQDKDRKATLLLDESRGILEVDQDGLLPYLRANLPDEAIEWLDTVFLLQTDESRAAPLFISGGNDGNFDFSVTFIGSLQSVFTEADRGGNSLLSSLFSEGLVETSGGAAGHFSPGSLGGPNGGQGFEGEGAVNPWDFILMIEGALLLAGAVTRRLGVQTGDRAAFPFCVSPVAAGFGSAASIDETSDGCRTELWLPLWLQAATLPELRSLFSEGRAQFGRRQARTAVEFALATCLLGVSRGIDSFARFGFLRRSGKMFLAAPLGRIAVAPRPRARLLNDPPLTDWIARLRSACRDKEKTPARYQAALRQIDQSLFAFTTRSGTTESADCAPLLEVLRTLGRAEQTLAGGLAFCKDKYLRPLQGLSSQWLQQANDDSPEFRLAASLAGISPALKIGPLRVYLEQVEMKGPYANWSPGSTSAVWSNRPLASNLAAVFQRRQLEAYRAGAEGVPLGSPYPARLSDVVAFLNEEIDNEKLNDLLWALVGLDWSKPESPEGLADTNEVPFEFGVARLLVEKQSFSAHDNRWILARGAGSATVPDPEVFHALSSGRPDAVEQCVDRAALRLKSSGLLVIGYRNRLRSGKPLEIQSPIPGDRLLASMLFPLSDREVITIANCVLYPPETEE